MNYRKLSDANLRKEHGNKEDASKRVHYLNGCAL